MIDIILISSLSINLKKDQYFMILDAILLVEALPLRTAGCWFFSIFKTEEERIMA